MLKARPRVLTTQGMQLPVVSMSRGARGVRLIARSIDEHIHR
jgi:hypothetical protein